MVALLSELGLVGHEPSFPLGSPGPHALVSLPACLQACRKWNRQHPGVQQPACAILVGQGWVLACQPAGF